MFNRLLVAIDGSANAKRAANAAVELAKKTGASISVIHVIPTLAYAVESEEAPLSQVASQYVSLARGKAENWVKDAVAMAHRENVKADGEIVEDASGSVVQAIVDFAKKSNVDLIIIGTRGLSDFKRALLGSVSSGVLSHSECSVLAVK